MYKIKFSKLALKDKKLIEKSKLMKIVNNLLHKIEENPFCYPPSYEKLYLKYKMYSRRISRQHRLVYMVNEEKKEIYIIRMWTHYELVDKK